MAEVSEVALEPIGAVRRTQIGREATEPMREDIRLLGAILGETVREQNGEQVFDLVERARVESFRVRRSEIDRAQLAQLFSGIDIHRAIPVIRAFSHFALLANVAEDIHRERRRAVHVAAGEPQPDSTLAATYLKLDAADLSADAVADALRGALVSPVITAHPTETRRRTVFDTQHRITQLMRMRLHGQDETDDGRSIDTELRRQILTLWQTALIRLSRLKIQDEIEVGLRYYPAALFEVIPKVNGEVRNALRSRWPDANLLEQPILRPGSWIGGDRDGNPNVTGEVIRLATGSAAHAALGHYLQQLTRLERELSMSARLVKTSPELLELAGPCDEPARADEPYRRALRVVHGRLSATAREILDRQPQHLIDLGLQAYRSSDELLADLDVIDASLRDHGSALLADDRLARLREAVDVFGFHLSGLDLRQNSEVHEEVVAELLAWVGLGDRMHVMPSALSYALVHMDNGGLLGLLRRSRDLRLIMMGFACGLRPMRKWIASGAASSDAQAGREIDALFMQEIDAIQHNLENDTGASHGIQRVVSSNAIPVAGASADDALPPGNSRACLSGPSM